MGAASLMLAGVTLLSASGAALAAVPLATPASEAIPGSHSPGNDTGFTGSLHYEDGSTLAKLYLFIDTTNVASRTYLSVTKNGNAVANACSGTTAVTCQFKTVRFNDTFVVTVGFDPADDASDVTAAYAWSTTGSTGSDGGTSHGDTWPTLPIVLVSDARSDDGDFGGGFIAVSGSGVGNGQAVNASNRQAAKLAGLAAGIGATVFDGGTASGTCGTVDCSTSFGNWVEVNVGHGENFAAFQIVITYYSGTPKGFVHNYIQNGVESWELVGPCAKRSPVVPCFTWNSRLNQATITTLHNGSWRGL